MIVNSMNCHRTAWQPIVQILSELSDRKLRFQAVRWRKPSLEIRFGIPQVTIARPNTKILPLTLLR